MAEAGLAGKSRTWKSCRSKRFPKRTRSQTRTRSHPVGPNSMWTRGTSKDPGAGHCQAPLTLAQGGEAASPPGREGRGQRPASGEEEGREVPWNRLPKSLRATHPMGSSLAYFPFNLLVFAMICSHLLSLFHPSVAQTESCLFSYLTVFLVLIFLF